MSTCLACVLDRKAFGAPADAVVIATLAYLKRSMFSVWTVRRNLCLLHAGAFDDAVEATPDVEVQR